VGGPRFGVFRNTGTAVVGERTYTTAGSLSAGHLADVDLDGDLDLVGANASLGGAMVIKNYGPGALQGTFNDGVGCGTGDYWMNFNIAFQTQASPDPVLQLQTQYDAWRTSLVGRVDAVQSRAYFVPAHLPADGVSTSEMTIVLRDWNGNPVTAPMTNLTVSHAGGPGWSTIGAVTSLGGGVYRVVITAGNQNANHAIESYRVVVDDGQRPVTLMPAPQLALYGAGLYGGICYADCDDSNMPPMLNVADFTCFLQLYAQGNPYANCDSSTTPPVLNVADFTCFLQRFAAGCP
jgi:hypothetical protein